MSKDVKKAFGELIRKARLSQNLTQEDLADKASLHSTYIGQIERGLRNPSLVNIHKIKKALGVNINAIFPK